MTAGNETISYAPPPEPRPARSNAWAYYLVAGVVMALALFFANSYRRAVMAERYWPAVRGTVTDSSVRRVGGRRGSASYLTYITYAYTAENIPCASAPTEVLRASVFLSRAAAETALDGKYGRGRMITVYYNPADPADSTLGRASAPNVFTPLALAMVAGLIFIFARRQ